MEEHFLPQRWMLTMWAKSRKQREILPKEAWMRGEAEKGKELNLFHRKQRETLNP